MISEGVDIKRLRVLIYLPNALTELAFRQAIGRVVRTAGPTDDTRAYVVMPSFETFEEYARRVEDEMPVNDGKDDAISLSDKSVARSAKPKTNSRQRSVRVAAISFRGAGQPAFKSCPACSALNVNSAVSCKAVARRSRSASCSRSMKPCALAQSFEGSTSRKDEVQLGEEMAAPVRERILRSGDEQLVRNSYPARERVSPALKASCRTHRPASRNPQPWENIRRDRPNEKSLRRSEGH